MTFALFLLINSCKKQLWVPEAPSEALVAKAKSFYAQQAMRIELKDRQVMGTKVQGSKTSKRKTPVPIWDNAVLETTTGGETILTVPMAKYQLNNEDRDYARKFVFSERGGEIVDGGIVEVYGPKAFIAGQGDGMIARKGDKQIKGFTGLIIEYNLDYGYRDGKYYKDGVVKKGSAYVGTKRPDITQKQAPKKSNIRATATVPEEPDVNLVYKPAQKISSFVPIFEDGQNCDYYYRVYIERDEYGAITYWENLGFAYSICVATEDPNQPGGITEYFIDCAGVINGSASDINECNTCMGGTTGITECPPPRDIRNKTTDTCIFKTVEAALGANGDVEGMLANIIQRFDASKTVTLNIFNGTTANGGPGQYQGQGFINNIFQANITLGTAAMTGSSKEFAISVLIHEFVHAYIHTSGSTILQSDHNTISSKYITPMAAYLVQYFGIDIKDAYALAWYGVGDSNVFNSNTPSNTEYTMSNNLKITKSEILNIGLAYSRNQVYAEDEIKRGIAICK